MLPSWMGRKERYFHTKLQNMHNSSSIIGKSLKSNTDLHCLNLPAPNLMPPLKRYHQNFGKTSLVIKVCQDLFCRWFPLLTWDSSRSCTTWLAWKSLCYFLRDESCKTLLTYLMLVGSEEGFGLPPVNCERQILDFDLRCH